MRSIRKILLIVFCSIIALLLLLYIFAPKSYTVLLVGSDQRGTERSRSDVMLLVTIPKSAKKQPVFLSIPRDTKVEDKEYGLQKMTHFYALGERPDDGKVLGNIDLTKKQIEKMTGIKVDATVEVTFGSFEDVIDTAGGVTLDGKETKSGDALAQIRDRFTNGRSDFSRQEDEQQVFRSLLTRIKSPTTLRAIYNYFQTSEKARLQFKKVKLGYFLVGAGIARHGDIAIGEVKQLEVPGKGEKIYTPDFGKELYYWVVDEDAFHTMLKENY